MRAAILLLSLLVAGCSSNGESKTSADQPPAVATLRREIAVYHNAIDKVTATGHVTLRTRSGYSTTYEADFVLGPGGELSITLGRSSDDTLKLTRKARGKSVDVFADPEKHQDLRNGGETLSDLVYWWLDTSQTFYRATPYEVTETDVPVGDGQTARGYLFTHRLRSGNQVTSTVPWHTRRVSGYDFIAGDGKPMQRVTCSDWNWYSNGHGSNYKKAPPDPLPWPMLVTLENEEVSATIRFKSVKLNVPESPEHRP